MPKFIVLSAPSGAGKTTIAKILARRNANMVIAISATTRSKRPREVDGKDYYFMSKEEFKKHIHNADFLEYEQVHGDFYGTRLNIVENLQNSGKFVLFDIDVKGALNIKKSYPDSLLIFIKAPSIEELQNRLKRRRSDSIVAIQKRLNRIKFEYEQAKKFDHIVINENLEETVQHIEQLVKQTTE
jgi:guanylate kinase